MQEVALRRILERLHMGGVRRQLVSLPTGAGKTVLFAALARKLQARTLVLVDRWE